MSVLDWIKSKWNPGDFAILPRIQKDTTVGRIEQLTVTPCVEKLAKLRRKAQKRRSDGHVVKRKGQ